MNLLRGICWLLVAGLLGETWDCFDLFVCLPVISSSALLSKWTSFALSVFSSVPAFALFSFLHPFYHSRGGLSFFPPFLSGSYSSLLPGPQKDRGGASFFPFLLWHLFPAWLCAQLSFSRSGLFVRQSVCSAFLFFDLFAGSPSCFSIPLR